MNKHINKTDNAIDLCKIDYKEVRSYKFYNYIKKVIGTTTRLNDKSEVTPMVTGFRDKIRVQQK